MFRNKVNILLDNTMSLIDYYRYQKFVSAMLVVAENGCRF